MIYLWVIVFRKVSGHCAALPQVWSFIGSRIHIKSFAGMTLKTLAFFQYTQRVEKFIEIPLTEDDDVQLFRQ